MKKLLIPLLALAPLFGGCTYYGVPTAYVEGVPVAYAVHAMPVALQPYTTVVQPTPIVIQQTPAMVQPVPVMVQQPVMVQPAPMVVK